MSKTIEIKGLAKSFRTGEERIVAFEAVNLEVNEGEFVVLLGPSGSGKTTLLRCVAGLEKPDTGDIVLGGRCVYSSIKRIVVRPEERQLGMVFQSYAIWPHMSVFDNVALPLKRGLAKIPKEQVGERVLDALSLVGMENMAERPAPQLSGGQQQRVALARSLALQPKILLMDEPLSNLDARLREDVREVVRDVVQRVGVTVLYVTHDQAEAMDLADRIMVLHQGRVLQVGSAEDLYNRPVTPDVAQFLGTMNWITGVVVDKGKVSTAIGEFEVNVMGLPAETPVTLGVRPEALELAVETNIQGDGAIVIPAVVTSITFLGDHYLYRMQVGDNYFSAKVPLKFSHKGEIYLKIPFDRVCMFPR